MTLKGCKIRRATAKDLIFVKQLDKKNMTPIMKKYKVKYSSLLFDNFNPKNCFIIENKNKKIGFGYVEISKDILELDSVQINPKFQGKGYGKLLIDYIIKLARKKGLTMIISEAHKTNEKSVNFHKKMGFKIVGRNRKGKIKFRLDLK